MHRLDNAGQVGPRVKQPDLRLHGKRMTALLHDGRALAIVFADDDQSPTSDATRGQVGQGIRRHIGADGRFPGDRATDRVHDRGRQSGRGRSLAGAGLEMNPEFLQDGLGIGQHIHQVGDGRALVTRHIPNPAFKQGLGHSKNALAVKHRARLGPQLLDFCRE